jgi:hypothetical protein
LRLSPFIAGLVSPVIAGIVALTLLAGPVDAQTRQVCLNDQAGLNAPAEGAFYREFQSLLGGRGVQLVEQGCEPDSIQLSVYRQASGRKHDALGAARVEGTAITPQLEVYLDNVVALLSDSQCWTVVGRAIARVAAHEVAHYLDQSAEHDESGLLRARFSGSDLAADDSHPFRWTVRPSQGPDRRENLASVDHN